MYTYHFKTQLDELGESQNLKKFNHKNVLVTFKTRQDKTRQDKTKQLTKPTYVFSKSHRPSIQKQPQTRMGLHKPCGVLLLGVLVHLFHWHQLVHVWLWQRKEIGDIHEGHAAGFDEEGGQWICFLRESGLGWWVQISKAANVRLLLILNKLQVPSNTSPN